MADEREILAAAATCREWEVKLNNTIELTFDDKRFALKEYDD